MDKAVLILTALGVTIMAFYFIKKGMAKAEETKDKEEAGRRAKEKAISAQKKLHEEEKKRWEDEYWKRQDKREG